MNDDYIDYDELGEEMADRYISSHRKEIINPLAGALNIVYDASPLPELSKLFGSKGYGVYDFLYDIQDKYVPFNSAYQNWLNGREQDPVDNVIDGAIVAIPALKGNKAAIKKLMKNKDGFIRIPDVYGSKNTKNTKKKKTNKKAEKEMTERERRAVTGASNDDTFDDDEILDSYY